MTDDDFYYLPVWKGIVEVLNLDPEQYSNIAKFINDSLSVEVYFRALGAMTFPRGFDHGNEYSITDMLRKW